MKFGYLLLVGSTMLVNSASATLDSADKTKTMSNLGFDNPLGNWQGRQGRRFWSGGQGTDIQFGDDFGQGVNFRGWGGGGGGKRRWSRRGRGFNWKGPVGDNFGDQFGDDDYEQQADGNNMRSWRWNTQSRVDDDFGGQRGRGGKFIDFTADFDGNMGRPNRRNWRSIRINGQTDALNPGQLITEIINDKRNPKLNVPSQNVQTDFVQSLTNIKKKLKKKKKKNKDISTGSTIDQNDNEDDLQQESDDQQQVASNQNGENTNN